MKISLIETPISSLLVHDGFLKLFQDQVLLPDGNRSQREYIQHPGAAMIMPVLDDGRVLMIEQYRYPVKKTFLEFPAGKIDLPESSVETAHRELHEEVGFKAKTLEHLTSIHPVIGYSTEIIDLFVATGLENIGRKLEQDEFLNPVIMTIDQLEEKIWNSEITDVKTQIGFFWLKRYLSK